MTKIEALKRVRLHAKCDPERIPWAESSEIPLTRRDMKTHFQPRAMQALDLALQIKLPGYNVYVSGDVGLGRTHTVLSYLGPIAKKAAVPPDLVYVHNFQNPDSPRLFSLPPGSGAKVKKMVADAMEAVFKKLSTRMDNLGYVQKHAALVDEFQKVKRELLSKMNAVAHGQDFHLEYDDTGSLTLCPMADGKRLGDEEFEKLDSTVRQEFKRKGDALVHNMAGMMRQLARAEETFQNNEKDLDRAAMGEVLDALWTPVVQKIEKLTHNEAFGGFLAEVCEDILKNTEIFFLRERDQQQVAERAAQTENILSHYEINLLVDNQKTEGAPIIVETHPTAANLLGCVEREAELGALVTNFTLIRAGSVHRANGGYLILHIDDILQYPNAWEGLVRALRANEMRIEDIDDVSDATIRTKGITPEPLPLQLKVILIGREDFYETLLDSDDRFAKLFRIKAHLAEVCERNAQNMRRYLVEIAHIVKEDGLLSFDRSAMAWLVDHGCHLSEDQRRLSLRFPLLREIMIEACALAGTRRLERVSSEILEEAYAARTYRANLVEEVYLEEYDRNMIKVQTRGTAIGQVNGLSVTMYGDFEFGLPHRISCTVGVGQEGIIDLEREAELGGPIHTKAMMILKSFLIKHFARTKPLVLSGSLYFEQSYAGIEGDSASGAELVALLSALAEVPVRLDLAFTGAISHTGEILPVGGVTRKIEGFFKVCKHQGGLTGTQGVLIPYDNVDQLMLEPDVLEAVDQEKFAIYPVKTIEDALWLLTGLRAGNCLKRGGYTAGTIYDLVDQRLQRLGEYSQNAFRRSAPKKKERK